MKKWIFFSFCFFSITVFSQNADEVGIFINPATIDFNLSQGQTGNSKIMIINKTPVKKLFRIYLSDWVRDTVGKHAYTKPGSIKNSCANWITLDKEFAELGPGESMPVNVKLQAPDSAGAVKEMRWAMVFLETIEEKITVPKKDKDLLGAAVTTQYRIGVHIYQTPPAVSHRDVRMLSFAPKANTADSVYRIVCQNTGSIQLRCKSYIELSNLADGKKTVVKADEIPLFPDQKRYIDFVIPKSLPKGQYTLLAAVDGGVDLPLEAAQKTIEIK